MTLTIMCGLPNSGKTTKATALAESTGATLIRHDDYYSRVITTTTFVKKEHLEQVTQLVLNDIKAHLENGEDVIYDAVNNTIASRQKVIETCAVDGCRYVCVYMDTPLDQSLERDKSGWTSVFSRNFEIPTEDEKFDEIIFSQDGRNASQN